MIRKICGQGISENFLIGEKYISGASHEGCFKRDLSDARPILFMVGTDQNIRHSYSIFKTRHAVLSKGRSLAFDLAEAKRYPGVPNKEKGTFKIMDFPS